MRHDYGRLEGWKIGRLESWGRDPLFGQLSYRSFFHPSNLLIFQLMTERIYD